MIYIYIYYINIVFLKYLYIYIYICCKIYLPSIIIHMMIQSGSGTYLYNHVYCNNIYIYYIILYYIYIYYIYTSIFRGVQNFRP